MANSPQGEEALACDRRPADGVGKLSQLVYALPTNGRSIRWWSTLNLTGEEAFVYDRYLTDPAEKLSEAEEGFSMGRVRKLCYIGNKRNGTILMSSVYPDVVP